MLTEWRKFKGWAVMEFFLERPNTKIHIRELARRLKISPLTAQRYLKLYGSEGVLNSEKAANSVQYSLDNQSPLVQSLKRFYFLTRLGSIKPRGDVVSIALFGAHASGEYTEQSDIDILMITQNRDIDLGLFKKIERGMGNTVDVTRMSLGEWRKAVKGHDNFAESVLRNHILLWGAKI